MAKFPWQKTEKEDGTTELTLPDELQQQIKAGADAAAALPKILEGLMRIQQDQSDADKADKAAKDATDAAALRRQNDDAKSTIDEQVEELMLAGRTREAIALVNGPLANEVLLGRFDRTKREVFEDDKSFEYYHGDIKREVDSLLDAQTLAFKSNPQTARENIKNCYDTVVGRHHKEILEGKIKTRFAAGESGSRGTASGSAGDSGSNDAEKERVLAGMMTDPMVLRAARQTGIPVKDYVKMLDEEGIGYA